jgi:hypothetical protein
MSSIHLYPAPSMLHPHRRIQSEIRDYMRTRGWAAPHAVTLTMKQVLHTGNARFVGITAERASQNFRHFLNLLNRRIFGKAAARFGSSVKCLCVLEGGTEKRYHYHAVIDCPRPDLLERFPSMIEHAWKQTDWSYAETDIKPYSDDGWIDYISKFRDKPDYASAFDWMNCHTG